jgi:PIN domain nuclease of toxin-antitoxin system
LFAALSAHEVRPLGIGVEDAHRAANLDWEHRDPFDRMLVAQALRMGGAIVTRDRQIVDADLIAAIAA